VNCECGQLIDFFICFFIFLGTQKDALNLCAVASERGVREVRERSKEKRKRGAGKRGGGRS
jgi:hypothetical protein